MRRSPISFVLIFSLCSFVLLLKASNIDIVPKLYLCQSCFLQAFPPPVFWPWLPGWRPRTCRRRPAGWAPPWSAASPSALGQRRQTSCLGQSIPRFSARPSSGLRQSRWDLRRFRAAEQSRPTVSGSQCRRLQRLRQLLGRQRCYLNMMFVH